MGLGSVELRAYQARDVRRFLDVPACLVAYGKRGGKTLTALALTLQRWEQSGDNRPVLVVSDKDSPWSRDLSKVGFPLDRFHRIHNGEESLYRRSKAKIEFRRLLSSAQPGHIYQVHWAALAPELELLKSVGWFTIIADEVHAAKNRNSQRTKSLKRLRAAFRIGLTADPDDDVLPDLWSLLEWLYPKQYRSYWKWVRKHFEVYTARGASGDYLVIGEPLDIEALRAEIAPFFVIMGLDEIDPGQLPHVYEEHLVGMTPEQATAYEQMLDWQLMQLGDDEVVAAWPMVAAMRLQQLAQAMGIAEQRKVWKWVTEDDPDTGDRRRIRKLVDSIRVNQIEPSPKLDDMMATLASDTTPCGPTIIFTQFPGMLDLACKRMDAAAMEYVAVRDGAEVNRAESAFQNGEVDILIGSIGIISESIELSRASTEIFLDCPWNPRVRGQAEDRAREYGRRTPVRIIDIRTEHTVDFERLDRVRTKQEWKDALRGRGVYGNGKTQY